MAPVRKHQLRSTAKYTFCGQDIQEYKKSLV